MSLEDIFKASRDNINPKKYSGGVNPSIDRSKLNADSISKYTGKSKLMSDTSKLNLNYTPTKYH